MDSHYQLFRDQFRAARTLALADAEGFLAVIQALELTGQQLSGRINGLACYKPALVKLADRSLFSSAIPEALPTWHTSFSLLYDELRQARNDAVHQGSYARTTTGHALDLAIILEDALMSEASRVSQFMVHDVVLAQPWHPISYIRQLMLKNAFSYLPVLASNQWRLISESSVARYIRGADSIGQKKERLLVHVSHAIGSALPTIEATTVHPNTPIKEALDKIGDYPILVVSESDQTHLVGLLTASDLL